MGSKKSSFTNTLVVAFLKGLSKLPFPVLYALSDFLSIVLQYGVGYRRKVVETNIRKAFPEKGEKEIRRIMRAFYVHFCDITLETAKAWSMSREDFDKRVVVKGAEEMNRLCGEGKSVVLVAMHHNNWEWTSYSQLFLKHKYLVIYNPVRNNPQLEDFLLQMRERWGAKTIPVDKSARTVIDFNRLNIPVCLGLVADQRPPFVTKFWTTFMNQEACFNQGPEKIAQRTNQPVFFALMSKLKRGHYELSFIPLIYSPAELTNEEIMLKYIRAMEEYIRDAPEYYLWSHNRWKQQRPEGVKLYK